MKIKEFLRELGYATVYNESLTIMVDSYDVTLYINGDGEPIDVYLKDLVGDNYLIARLYSDLDNRTDTFAPWCENELVRGYVSERFDRKEIPTNDKNV